MLATSGPEGSGICKQREREDHASAWGRLGQSAVRKANLGTPWRRSHEREAKGAGFWVVRIRPFGRRQGSGTPFSPGDKKGHTAKPGGARWDAGSLNWSALFSHFTQYGVAARKWGVRLVLSRLGLGNFGLCPQPRALISWTLPWGGMEPCRYFVFFGFVNIRIRSARGRLTSLLRD